jgi:hypothetical protein
MAKAVIYDIKPGITGSVKSSEFSKTSVASIDNTAKITGLENTYSKFLETDYGIAKVVVETRISKITPVLPFRIKFTTIGLNSGYGPNNPAPIGIAIIGTNNYIL